MPALAQLRLRPRLLVGVLAGAGLQRWQAGKPPP